MRLPGTLQSAKIWVLARQLNWPQLWEQSWDSDGPGTMHGHLQLCTPAKLLYIRLPGKAVARELCGEELNAHQLGDCAEGFFSPWERKRNISQPCGSEVKSGPPSPDAREQWLLACLSPPFPTAHMYEGRRILFSRG